MNRDPCRLKPKSGFFRTGEMSPTQNLTCVGHWRAISEREIYEICTRDLADVEDVLDSLLMWMKEHPEKMDKAL